MMVARAAGDLRMRLMVGVFVLKPRAAMAVAWTGGGRASERMMLWGKRRRVRLGLRLVEVDVACARVRVREWCWWSAVAIDYVPAAAPRPGPRAPASTLTRAST